MRVEFPYANERSSLFGTVSRPVAKVTLENEFPQWMYVDSGADITLIPLSVGKLIGLHRTITDTVERIFGIGESSIPFVVRRVSMQLGDAKFQARLAWSQVEDVPLLLGRMDIFRRFDVTFREKTRTTIFSS